MISTASAMSSSIKALRATPRLGSSRPSSPGKFNLSPRFTGRLQTRTLACSAFLNQQQKPPASTPFTPRDSGISASHPSRIGEQSYATESRGPPPPPQKEYMNLESGQEAPTFLGTTKRLPEFNLTDKIMLVSGGARGLGLVQAEALLEAGATGKLHCLTADPLLPRTITESL